MLPAPTFDDIMERAEAFASPRPLRDRLVSIVFANPSSPVWRDLHTNRAFLDERTGTDWDLFFAGMSGFAPMENGAERLQDPHWHEEWTRYFNPTLFTQLERRVSNGHAAALDEANARQPVPWRYSGGTDLVSFMTYGRKPDWLSLIGVRIDGGQSDSAYGRTLGEISEGLRQWMLDDVDQDLAPGTAPDHITVPTLAHALAWSAAGMVTQSVIGDAVGNLLAMLMN